MTTAEKSTDMGRCPSYLSPALQNLIFLSGMGTDVDLALGLNHFELKDTEQSQNDPNLINSKYCHYTGDTTGSRVLKEDDFNVCRGCKLTCSDGLLKFVEKFQGNSVLRLVNMESFDAVYYERFVSQLSPLFKYAEDMLSKLSTGQFVEKYQNCFLWTKSIEIFTEAHCLLLQESNSYDVLALLIISVTLERSLGRLFLLRGNQCPTMLKDLLSSPELSDVIGSTPLRILQTVMGPPISMNLRNVSWHGFFSDGELPRRYVYFLLLFTASIGKLLGTKRYDPNSIPCRDSVSISSVDDIASYFSGLSDDDMHCAKQVVLDSWIVDNSNRGFFSEAFKLHQEKQHGKCSVMLLPLLEHTLRRFFVKVNNCPARLITAETTTLFTTFEEILDPVLPDGGENKVMKVLGEPCLDLLHDLLVYPAGPRCRDKLGHGESDYRQVSAGLPWVLILLFAWLAGKHGAKEELNQAMSKLEITMCNYTSMFHPVALLKRKIIYLAGKTHELFTEISLSPDMEPWNVKVGCEAFTQNNVAFSDALAALSGFTSHVKVEEDFTEQWRKLVDSFQKPMSNNEEQVKDTVHSVKLRTLYRWKKDVDQFIGDEASERQSTSGTVDKTSKVNQSQAKSANCRPGSASAVVTESEIVGLLSRIVFETNCSIEQACTMIGQRQRQFDLKQLRSRQRDNLQRLLLFTPCAGLITNYIIYLATYILSNLDQYGNLSSAQCKALQKYLRSTLQSVENLRTYTGPDKNKWSEAADLVSLEITRGCNWVEKQKIFHID